MDWQTVHAILVFFQHCVSVIGIVIILTGVSIAFFHFIYVLYTTKLNKREKDINHIRVQLGRALLLGLEFIVAADLIGSTTTPDYYSVGLLAIIVAIRTLLSYSINREVNLLSRE